MLRSLDGHCASLLGCSLSSCYWSSPELKTSCPNPWLPSHLEPLHLEIGQQSLPGAQAESSWYTSSWGTPLQERITGLTELRPWRHLCSGITILGKRIQHRAWKITKQFGKNSSHMLAHLLVVREGLGVLLVFPRVSYLFLTANSNICHGIFDKRKFFLRHPVVLV